MTASVYVGVCPSRGVKIGYSNDPANRLKCVGREVGEPVSLSYQTAVLCDAPAVEALAHWTLRESHTGAEWFAVTPDEAEAAVLDAVQRVSDGASAPRRINNATAYDSLKEVRVQLLMDAGEIEALDEWRAKERIWSRSEAIRRLIADGVKKPAEKNKT